MSNMFEYKHSNRVRTPLLDCFGFKYRNTIFDKMNMNRHVIFFVNFVASFDSLTTKFKGSQQSHRNLIIWLRGLNYQRTMKMLLALFQ